MAFPSVTYTLTNGTTADASQVQQNFQDLINGLSDGTKSLNMAAGTFSGAVSISGAVTLGLSSSNLITWNGSLNTSIAVSTTNSFDIGSDPFGLASVYFGSVSSAHSTRLKGASVSSAYTFTLPLTPGSKGQVLQTDGSGTTSFVSSASGPEDIHNVGVAATQAGNAMTVLIKGSDGNDPSASNVVDVVFRNSTAATGTPSLVSITAATSVTITSTATLGSTNANANWVYVYLINNAGTAEVAVCGSRLFVDEGSLVTTTTMSASATSKTVLYSTTGRSNVAIRLVGRIKSTQATAGTWVTTPSEISLYPFTKNPVVSEINIDGTSNGGVHHGSTNIKARRLSTTNRNVGGGLTLLDSATLGTTITVVQDGIMTVSWHDRDTVNGAVVGVVINGSALTSNVTGVAFSQGLKQMANAATLTGGIATVSWRGMVFAGDVLYLQDNGSNNVSSNQAMANILLEAF